MSFSFRSLFQREAGSPEPAQAGQQHFPKTHPGMTDAMNTSHSLMQASPTLQAPAGASPFQIGGNPLFKTAGKEPISAPPINSSSGMSPFAIAGATPTNAPLTVGDVIDQLPPEVVRAGALPAEQPLSLPPALLENALRSGQAALPVFELYRVCPALFQMPISPQDPRLVPLPAAKLPGLILQAREGQEAAGKNAMHPASPSPFSLAQLSSHPPASTFQLAAKPEVEAATAQPFPMSPFAVAAPAHAPSESASAAPASPFSIKPAAENTAPSPFSIKQEPQTASPFSIKPASPQEPAPTQPQPGFSAGNSPFSLIQPVASPFAASASASPFAAVPSAASSSPFAAASAPGSNSPQDSISSLFTAKAPEPSPTPTPQATTSAPPSLPFGSAFAAAMKEPDRAHSPAPQPFAPVQATTPPMPAPNSAASGMAKLGFSAVLAGYSVEELGFNPVMVPAWITTSVPASTLNEQISSGSVTIELGALVDGLSDIGFRNTLTAAKRDVRIKLPQNEVFHALTSMSAAPAVSAPPSAPQQETAFRPAAPASNAFVIQPGAPAGQVTRVEPASPPSPFAAPSPQTIAPQAVQPTPHPLSAFASPSVASEGAAQPSFPQPASSSLFAPKFGAALNPFAQSQPPAPQAEAAPAAAPAPQQPFGGTSPFAFTPPVPSEAPVKAHPQPSSNPVQPLAGVFQPFGSPPPSQPASVQAPLTKPFDPFAASSGQPSSPLLKPQQESGFSSAQLLGQAQAPLAPQTPGMFSPPPANLFKPAPEFGEPPHAHEPARAPAATRGLFGAPPPASAPLFSEAAPSAKSASEFKPAPTPAQSAASPAKMTPVKHSFLGLSPVDTQTDQLLLRALLGTEENLAAPRVVELLATQHGLSACVCLHGSHVLSHADASKPDSTEFQRQAPEIARQLRGLAPLIGIEGAETFTLNASGRLLTFCFPGSTIVAVLHDDEPSIGLRDKITLIARELSRMLG